MSYDSPPFLFPHQTQQSGSHRVRFHAIQLLLLSSSYITISVSASLASLGRGRHSLHA
jgi:hypothetical protein